MQLAEQVKRHQVREPPQSLLMDEAHLQNLLTDRQALLKSLKRKRVWILKMILIFLNLILSPLNKGNTQEANPMDEYTKGCPPGLYRIYLTPSSQQAYNLRMDEDVTQEDNIRTIQKQQIIDDIGKREAGSDFHPIKQFLESYPEEDVRIIYDYEFTYDKNFFICLSKELREIIDNVSLFITSSLN